MGDKQELCLVIPRASLFGYSEEHAFEGFNPKWSGDIGTQLKENSLYVPRYPMNGYCGAEDDPALKQIIPMGVFTVNNKFFAYRRLAGSSEQRLHNTYNLLVGGHVNPTDGTQPTLEMLIASLKREFHEELNYVDPYTITPIGVVNDDTTDVGKVHFGLIYLIKGTTENVSVRETASYEGSLQTIEEIQANYATMNSWQKFTFDFLMKNPAVEQQHILPSAPEQSQK